jgi:8-oxo-dGTP pyrophosphatase MutT (NUDIX family)
MSRVPRRRRCVEEQSAGGFVVNDAWAVALIGRRSRRHQLLWSLPKGHIEVGETAADAAVREIEEETGIRGRVLGELGAIDFWFTDGARRIHKTVQHFLLGYVGGELCADDHEVAAVEWVPFSAVPSTLAYPDERRLAGRAEDLARRILR